MLVAAEESFDDPNGTDQGAEALLDDGTKRSLRLVFSRHSKSKGWWLWNFLSGGKANRSRNTPKGVLRQIAAEMPLYHAAPSSDLALELIRRSLGIELPDNDQNQGSPVLSCSSPKGAASAPATVVAADLTWDLLEAAFKPVSEEGACQEVVGLITRLDKGGMHHDALQMLARIRVLDRSRVRAGTRVPADLLMLENSLQKMEARKLLALTEENMK